MKTKTAIQKLEGKAGVKFDLIEKMQKEINHIFNQDEVDFGRATEIISNGFKNRNYIYTTRDDIKTELWIYQDGIYVPNGESYVREFCRSILLKRYTESIAKHVIAKIKVDTYISSEEFFKNENIDEIPLQNGVLNLKTRKLTPFSSNKIFFNKLPLEYNPKAKCEEIDKFFGEVLGKKDDKKILYELAGFSLFREHFIEKAFMFVGKGRNGKSKTIELLKRFVGGINCCSVPINQMKPDSSAVRELHNKLLNVAGDLSSFDLKETATFKGVTGRDELSAKRKYLRDIMFVNYAKSVFGANELPRVYDMSDGFWMRWILLEFPYTFVKESEYNKLKDKNNFKKIDVNIVDKIATPDQMSGLLNKGLDGLDRLFKQKDFSYTTGAKEIKELWIRMSDSFKSFCMDELEHSNTAIYMKEELRKDFQAYCFKHKVKGAGDKSIKITLQEMFGASETRKMIESEYKMVWFGVKRKENLK